jgi:hypothetical protein
MTFIALVSLPMTFSILTPWWSAQGAPVNIDAKANYYEGLSPAATMEEGQPKAASELDRLEQEWRLTRINTRFKEAILISVLAVVSLVVVLSFMTRKDRKTTGTDIVHVSGLVFIIFGTIVLVVIADVDEQLTASIGILGAIAGYLFGRSAAGGSSGTGTTAPAGEGQQPVA